MNMPSLQTSVRGPSADLFDTPEGWVAAPVDAFVSWLKRRGDPKYPGFGPPLKPSSVKVYLAMWTNFTDWLRHEGIPVDRCEARDLIRFLDGDGRRDRKEKKEKHGKQTKHQRVRYRRLIERAYAYMRKVGVKMANNPAREAEFTDQAGPDDLTKFLSESDRAKLVRYLSGGTAEGISEDWTVVRDRALLGMILGAGVKVSEARRMTFNCIKGDRVTAYRGGFPHHTRLLPFAHRAIAEWTALWQAMQKGRDLEDIEADLVFPAMETGARRITKKNTPMHATSIYRRSQRAIADAGVQVVWDEAVAPACAKPIPRMCAQTLRNTYVALLIDDGATDALIIEYLGLALDDTVIRLRVAYEVARGLRPPPAGRPRKPRPRALVPEDAQPAHDEAAPAGSAAVRCVI